MGSSMAQRAWGEPQPLVPHCLGQSHSKALWHIPKISVFGAVGSRLLQQQTMGSLLVKVMH